MPALIPHSASAPCAVDSLSVTVQNINDQALQLRYTLQADLTTLRIPSTLQYQSKNPPPFIDNLWQHTCFEAFIYDNQGSGAYYEFNFSPNGAWAAYAFTQYRQRAHWQPQHFPTILTEQTLHHLTMTVTIPSRLFNLTSLEKPYLGLSAVLENHRGEHSWWALNHPCEQPDFHHPQSFTYAIRS